MSIQTQITRIQGLVTRLITKLRNLGFLDNQSHDFYDAVQACYNLGANLETKNMELGEDTPTPQVTPSSGYSAMSELSFTVNGEEINPQYIVQGNNIVGVAGTAITGSIEMRRLSFNVTVNNSQYFEIDGHNAYQGSQNVLPSFNEIMIFKKSGGSTYPSGVWEVVTLFYSFNESKWYWNLMNSSGQLTPTLHNDCTYNYTQNGRILRIQSLSNSIFNGSYTAYLYY